MRYNLLIGLFVVVTLFSLGFASAETLQEWNDESTGNGFTSIYDVNHAAAMFQVGVNGTGNFSATKVGAYLVKQGTVSTLYANITGLNASGAPNRSNVFAYGSADVSSMNAAGDWVNITMTSVKGLVNNTNYSINYYVVGGDASNRLKFQRQNPTTYRPGRYADSADSGANWNVFLDIAGLFKVYSGSTSATGTLNFPLDNVFITSPSINFNSTVTTGTTNINATVYVWNSTGIFNTTTKATSGTTDAPAFNISGFTPGIYKWNVYSCATGICNWVGNSNNTFTYGYQVNSQTFNSVAYETDLITISASINATTTPSATLNYNGSSYSGSITSLGNGAYSLSKQLGMTTGLLGPHSFYWTFTISGVQFNLTTQTQVVNLTQLNLCNSSSNVPFFNFTFIDESTLTAINGSIDSSFTYFLNSGDGTLTKSLSFLNSTTNPSYGFCFLPPWKTASVSGTVTAGNPLYASRTFTIGANYTNSSTSIPLYLLGSSSGITTSIQIMTQANQPISGVSVVAERQINSVWVTLGQATSDSSGIVTFFVSPNYPVRITATKTGYTTSQATIVPSQSIYTLQMSTGTGAVGAYNSSLAGLRWIIYPSTGRISETSSITYGMNLTAAYGNLYGCMIELMNNGTAIASSISTGSSHSCNVSVSSNIPSSARIYGRFSINTTESGGLFQYIDTDALWYKIETNTTTWSSIQQFFSEMSSLKEWGQDVDHREYTKIVLFFLAVMILMGILSYFTQYDSIYPGFAFVIVWILLVAASSGGWFTLDFGKANSNDSTFAGVSAISFYGIGSFFAQYWVVIISSLYLIGYLANYWARRNIQ